MCDGRNPNVRFKIDVNDRKREAMYRAPTFPFVVHCVRERILSQATIRVNQLPT